ncbi:hypothetical protein EYR40_003330 [Pleurotus pulmonarius]|nr:hypothetical protein EYR40_003330 [Pleurotus pulmonarius]
MGTKAVITQSAPNRPPTLGKGDVDASVLWDWFTKCENFLRHKDVSGLAMVKTVAYGMSGVRAIRWLAASGPLLHEMDWDTYKTQMRSLFLPSDWEHTTRMDILRFRQGSKVFIDYALELMGKNNLLAGTDSFMNDEFMRETIEAGLESELSRECNREGLGEIVEFSEWLDKANKPPHLPPMPKLTEPERQLLSANGGCYKCRKFWAGHVGSRCTAPPLDGSKYKTLTASDVPPRPANYSAYGNLSRSAVSAVVDNQNQFSSNASIAEVPETTAPTPTDCSVAAVLPNVAACSVDTDAWDYSDDEYAPSY